MVEKINEPIKFLCWLTTNIHLDQRMETERNFYFNNVALLYF
uniref:Uncharacterized protein n=3 Tax=Anguilla anguilla TaxID=7936 RepID=A0A0E9P8C6_ANGAN